MAEQGTQDAGFGFMSEAESMIGGMLAAAGPDPDDAPIPTASDPVAPPSDAPEPKAKAEPEPEPETPAEPNPDGEPEPEADPLEAFHALVAKASPLDYKVSGAAKTFDGIVVLPDGKGAFVPPDKLNDIRSRLSSAEVNRESSKSLHEQVQRYERVAYGEGEKRVTGLAAIQRIQEDKATVDAVGGLLFETLANPNRLLSLLTTDANGNVVPNPHAIRDLQARAQFIGEKAAFDLRSSRATEEQAWMRQQQEESGLSDAIPSAIDRAFPDADPADREAAKSVFGPMGKALMFRVTPETVEQYGYPAGTWMVDVSRMEGWFRDRAENRVRSTAQNTAKAKAEAENKARAAQKPEASTRTLPPRKRDGQFRSPSKSDVKMRKMTRTELQTALKRGEELPEDGLVPA